jgi:hypothetical protein
MVSIKQFLRLIDRYCAATRLAEATVSTRLLNDGKGIARLRSGRDIGVRKVEEKVGWLSDNWPEGAEWPADISRPPKSKTKKVSAS